MCARENIDNSELTILSSGTPPDLAGMLRLDLAFHDKVKDLVSVRHRTKLQEHLQGRLEKSRSRKCLSSSNKQLTRSKSSKSMISPSAHRLNNTSKHMSAIPSKYRFIHKIGL